MSGVWYELKTKYILTYLLWFKISTQAGQHTNATYKTEAASVDFVDGISKKQASILPALIKTFGPMFLFGAFLKLIQDLLTFVSPQILRYA